MEGKNSVAKSKNEQQTTASPVIFTCKQEDEMIVCEVCGHANPKYTALCKMCSNYLDN